MIHLCFRKSLVAPLGPYDRIQPEIRAGARSRLDLLLSNSKEERCFVEIKNCTLVRDGVACFPDAVITRGCQHLVELENLVYDTVIDLEKIRLGRPVPVDL